MYTVTAGRNIAWPLVIAKIAEAPLGGYGRLGMERAGLADAAPARIRRGLRPSPQRLPGDAPGQRVDRSSPGRALLSDDPGTAVALLRDPAQPSISWSPVPSRHSSSPLLVGVGGQPDLLPA